MGSIATTHAAPVRRISVAYARQDFAHAPAPPSGLQLLRPVYWIAGALISGVAFHYGGVEALSIALAAFIALWSFAEPRPTLANVTAFMVFLFVFFQNEAPLGDELPQEFFYWGAGLALITATICLATAFSRADDWSLVKRRLSQPLSIAVFAMFIIIGVAAVNGLLIGNQPFAVVRQLYGCVLLPVYYLLAVTLFRSSSDIDRWLSVVSWAVALGALWYAQKLSLVSVARGVYFREQSPLTTYAGAIGVIAFAALIERRNIWARLQGCVQLACCVAAIVFMGNRAALASLIVASGLLVIFGISRRGAIAAALATAIVAGSIGTAFYYGDPLLERRGLGGDIARRFIFKVLDDSSFQGRMAQMDAVMSTVRKSPVLGAGMGSETKFLAPVEGRVRVTSVDNGWGYVMLKMGVLGLLAFLVFLALLLRQSLSRLLHFRGGTPRASATALLGLLLYGIVVFWSGPSFFHFTSAGFFGTAFAGIAVLSESRAALTGAPQPS